MDYGITILCLISLGTAFLACLSFLEAKNEKMPLTTEDIEFKKAA